MNWLFVLTKFLHQDSYDDRDLQRTEIFSLKRINESFRQRINILEDEKRELQADIFELKRHEEILKKEVEKTELSSFKTNRTYLINGTRMKLSQWLNNIDEKGHVGDWIENNLDLSVLWGCMDDQAHQLRKLIYEHFGNKDPHVVEKKDTWQKPSELIVNDFKGDCDDWATFLYYVYDCVFGPLNKLYFALVGLNNKEGFGWANHATLLWQHSDNKFYVLESAVGKNTDYINQSLRDFARKDYTENFRYGRIVYMSNNKENYYQIAL